MSEPLKPIVITPGSSASVQLPDPPTIQALVISNKSQLDLLVSGLTSGGSKWLPAGIQDIFYNDGGNQGFLGIQSFNTANLPITQTSVVLATVYRTNEKIQQGSWPTSIPTQVVNTNAVSASTDKIDNQGNPPFTQFINVIPNDTSTVTWYADTGGNLVIQSDLAGVIVTLLKLVAGSNPQVLLGALSALTEVVGDLKVDGNVTVAGGAIYSPGGVNTIMAFDNTITRLQATSEIRLQVPGGSTRMTVDTSGIVNFNSGISLPTGGLLRDSIFTGTGSGTFAHGLSAIPGIILAIGQSGSTATFGYTNANASTVDIQVGASISWKAVAFRLT